MIHVRGRGLRSLSDLILGLPGETLRIAPRAASTSCIDAGTDEMHNFQAMMLKGSEMETRSRARKYRSTPASASCPRTTAMYAGEKVLRRRRDRRRHRHAELRRLPRRRARFALAFSIFWNNSWFDDAMDFAEGSASRRRSGSSACASAMERGHRRRAPAPRRVRHRDPQRAVPDRARPASSSTSQDGELRAAQRAARSATT